MYSFTSRQPSEDVVDLTASPSRNGFSRRKLSGARPPQNGLNPHIGAKKLVVKNLKKQSDWNPDEYFNSTWVRLDDALNKVFSGGQSTLPLEDLYRCVENLCRQGKASAVNSRLNEHLVKHLKGTVLTGLRLRSAQDEVSTLRAVLSAWSTWTSQVTIIRCIFYYMDRAYLLAYSKTNLNDVCISQFRSIVFEDPSLKSKVINGTCELVSRDRKQQDVDRHVLREAISMFHALATYSSSFEPRLLAMTQTFILSWAQDTSQSQKLPDYVRGLQALMSREVERCDLLGLDSATKRSIIDVIEEHSIQVQVDYLVESSSLAELLDNNDTASLEQLYELLKRRRLGKDLKPSFAKWTEETGTSIIFDDKAQDDMVVRLLSLKRRLDNTWNKCFQRDPELGHGLREAFETFMNKTKKGQSTWGTDNSKTGEMIAKYVDMLLRGGSKAIPTELSVGKGSSTEDREEDDDAGMDEDAEVNAQLDQVLDLFRFIHGKAVFEAFYKKDLAKRLLMGRSASADAERSMLTRLKTECGAGFTQNLEQMFKDVELGREEMSGYKDRLDSMESKPGALDLSVNVLSAAAWPTYPDIQVVIPADVNTAIEHFERYYKSKHSGRKLSWKHSLAHCQMKASFPKGTKEFVVSSFQAIILLLFNGLPQGEKLSYDHIKSVSGLPEAEVKRTLQSLACAKLRPLTKHPVGKEINTEDTFTVNLAFNHPRYRVRINQVQLKETKQENKETHERVAEDRNFECQAAIVRIMKSRKTIGHSELVAEVITATRSRGVLAVADIKKNIDRLIEKDYMEREEGNTYSYVA
ncbi:Cullin-domain-containing protein [Myriangium duriaei CBS 260.36]|uniref:Cullin-domain-containing protein n=1 Tax=Myriangium duriaei CBS 260.36 TaxID=1168546 RepID=A0A9P4MJ09_9PEZI|nr:Cullin-domain-containing protein [Myriangium duriaei CBS 260.36]